ncbi:hypothetical protein WICMUC_004864 [Wickerhamomyces mucosus]|uniref:Uncharacterized protein n=1 Tax=Wickerhamomyces mucosus TaxID=1378264 RepID=A0A9P8T9I2_9ASCO|nr:hypothetical protein WICMUC_004864 [Wickerhamomyces mucosus]
MSLKPEAVGELKDINNGQRFHLHPKIRLPMVFFITGLFGFMSGAKAGFRESSARFFIENLHRLPNTKGGWYLYHKRKGFVNLKSSLNLGIYRSWKYALLGISYFGMEFLLDSTRTKIDFLNTLISTISFSYIYSNYFRLSSYSSRNILISGAILGLGSGLLQDTMIYLRGEPIWYVNSFHTLKTRLI